MNTRVRFCGIQIRGFKNVHYGKVQMPESCDKNYFSNKADILGIYGQNGSGKTAVIEAIEVLQQLLAGETVTTALEDYICKDSDSCSFDVDFSIVDEEKSALVKYFVEFEKDNYVNWKIAKETLSVKNWNGDSFDKIKRLIDYDDKCSTVIANKSFFHALVNKKPENKIDLAVAKKLSEKDHCSFLFGKEGRKIFLDEKLENISDAYRNIIESLYHYAHLNLFVISNRNTGFINMNFLIPFAFKVEDDHRVRKGFLPVPIHEPTVVSEKQYELVKEIIRQMNVVLCTLIPKLHIGIYDHGVQLLEDGTKGYRIELVSKRDNVEIPLKYESEGIIKIISMLNALINVYNDPYSCLVIDELDSGIFEFLLGELLSEIEKGAKGQLIFTSHNLRILEMIQKRCILFSTTNPDNRYIWLQNVKSSNNLRDVYLRSILLGGQKEEIYEETDSYEIGRAFRRAGKVKKNGG